MALLHNSILRGYNSIYTHFSYIGDGDEEDFIGYCLTWAKFVRWHHDDESVNLFAKIEELLQDKTIFKNNDDEHGTHNRTSIPLTLLNDISCTTC